MVLPRKNYIAGQALILVLLGMAVVLTLVLSVVSTSVTDIDISTRDDESVRALNAAEAGIERSFLIAGSTEDTFDENNSQFSAEVTGIAESANFYNFPKSVATGETATLWYVDHDATGITCDSGACVPSSNTTLRVCFAPENTDISSAPALEISFFYDPTLQGVATGNFSGTRVMRVAYDPNPDRRAANGFSNPNSSTCTIDGISYAYSTPAINLQSIGIVGCGSPGCLLVARAKTLYNSSPTTLGFQSGAILPSQGVHVVSTGTSGDATRTLEAFRSYKEPPAIFDNAIFAESSLIK